MWLRYVFDLDVRHLGSVMCKTHTFLVYWTTDFASWTIVLVSVERFVSVIFPLKAKVRIVNHLTHTSTKAD